MSTAGRVVALIPAHNEERFIGSVVLMARRWCDSVVVVDDGSTDRTADVADAAGASVVRCSTNLGKAQALNVGFRVAAELGAAAIVCLDGDAQHDPQDIPRVAGPILRGEADVVIGSRYLDKAARRHIPRWRRLGQAALNVATNVLSETRTTDSQSGYRAFSRRALARLRFESSGLSVESEMQFLFRPADLVVREVAITARYLDGNKRNPLSHGLHVLGSMAQISLSRRRATAFLLSGLAALVLAAVIAVLAAHRLERTHVLPLVEMILSGLVFYMAVSGIRAAVERYAAPMMSLPGHVDGETQITPTGPG